ncbi:YceI family protein [Winogradskyella aurantia]|uniref:Polyisoprenoid-binding protein n=1 Tax=Winogradskyella aurantia TaxID=1915063 RepID=A0A265UVG8_9FLAO|nr:YceI family protein [Winogradskyella aurantia]OZV69309.1 polyisoprenoid-binding protein [Winogradskyella aurantia]
MKTIHLYAILLLLCFSTQIFSQTKSISLDNSDLKWTGKAAFSTYALTGNLAFKHGEVTIKNDSIIDLVISVDMTSLEHENKTLKSHLRSEDFFEVKTYRTATFKLSQSSKIGNGPFEVVGYLTIKDITKLKKFSVALNNDYSILSFNIGIDRTEYVVTFNSPSFYEKLKEDAIADIFNLAGSIEFH